MVLKLTNFDTNLSSRDTLTNLTKCKIHLTKNFWGHLEAFPRPYLKNHEFHFFSQNSPPSIYLSRATPTNLAICKTHRTQNFCASILLWHSLGEFVSHSNHHISKTTNFIFPQNFPPNHLVKPSHTTKLGQVQHPSNSKLLCTKTFMTLIWGDMEGITKTICKKSRISFFSKTPN